MGAFQSVAVYTQISRRAFDLGKLLKKLSQRHPCDIVFDSTGLKVYGEGEWKTRQDGISKRRTWRKLHIGMDPKSGEIIMAELTDNGEGAGDGEVAKQHINGLPKGVKRVFADGAYDGIEFRREVEKIEAEVIIPPPRGSVVHENPDGAMKKRNDPVLEILGLGRDDDGRRLWKKLKGYHRRSLVETTMYRIKQITGSNLRSRNLENQSVEACIRCLVINKMTGLGMPFGMWQ